MHHAKIINWFYYSWIVPLIYKRRFWCVLFCFRAFGLFFMYSWDWASPDCILWGFWTIWKSLVNWAFWLSLANSFSSLTLCSVHEASWEENWSRDTPISQFTHVFLHYKLNKLIRSYAKRAILITSYAKRAMHACFLSLEVQVSHYTFHNASYEEYWFVH